MIVPEPGRGPPRGEASATGADAWRGQNRAAVAEAVACRNGVCAIGDVLDTGAVFAASDGANAAAVWVKAIALGSISVPPWPSLSTG